MLKWCQECNQLKNRHAFELASRVCSSPEGSGNLCAACKRPQNYGFRLVSTYQIRHTVQTCDYCGWSSAAQLWLLCSAAGFVYQLEHGVHDMCPYQGPNGLPFGKRFEKAFEHILPATSFEATHWVLWKSSLCSHTCPRDRAAASSWYLCGAGHLAFLCLTRESCFNQKNLLHRSTFGCGCNLITRDSKSIIQSTCRCCSCFHCS